MISTELIRRYTFFAGLNPDQLKHVAQVAQELNVEAGYSFFREGDELDTFYIVTEGIVDLAIEIPDQLKEHSLTSQLTNNLDMVDITVSNAREGNVFGWSAIIPPNISTASATASVACTVLAFDCAQLQPILDDDCEFALQLSLRAAQIIRSRLRDMRVESLAFVSTM